MNAKYYKFGPRIPRVDKLAELKQLAEVGRKALESVAELRRLIDLHGSMRASLGCEDGIHEDQPAEWEKMLETKAKIDAILDSMTLEQWQGIHGTDADSTAGSKSCDTKSESA